MDLLLFLAILAGIGYWIYVVAHRQGKHQGSQKAYGVGRGHAPYGRHIKKPF